MKLLCFTDNHFCEAYSILNRLGNKYTERLENQIECINWVEEMAIQYGCDAVACLGDFFDHPSLTEQELTALQDIKWNNLPHYFLVGNHESDNVDLRFNSAKALEKPNFFIVSEIASIDCGNNTELYFLPYVKESEKQPNLNGIGPLANKNRIVFSHNDIKGIQLGPVESKVGFTVDEIKACSSLFINGHLHNGQLVAENVLNLGNLTGKDFGENAKKYPHNIMILDTNDFYNYKLIENPLAFNFYKLSINTEKDLKLLDNLKSKAVVTLKCTEDMVQKTKEKLKEKTIAGEIINSRVVVALQNHTESQGNIEDLSMDYLEKFNTYCHSIINNTEALEEELSLICRA